MSSFLTSTELEALLHSTLRGERLLLPKTIEDVSRLKSLDLSDVPSPDLAEFSAKLRSSID